MMRIAGLSGSRLWSRRLLATGALWAVVGTAASAVEPEAVPEDSESQAPAGADARLVAMGSSIQLEYTVTTSHGQVIDQSEGGAGVPVKIGAGQLLPALEKQLVGMRVGEQKQVTLEPRQAYGETRLEAIQAISLDAIPAEYHRPGALVQAELDGSTQLIEIQEVQKDRLIVNFNHPLAGQTLIWDVTVVGMD